MGFGSSSEKSSNSAQQSSLAYNQSYPFLQSALGGNVSLANRGSTAIADLLGLNGSSSQDSGFQKFRDSSGYNFIQSEGLKGLTANNAVKGLLNSGSAFTRASQHNTDLADRFLSSYLAQLSGLSSTGLQSAQILSSAGNTASSQGTSSGTSSGSSTSFKLS